MTDYPDASFNDVAFANNLWVAVGHEYNYDTKTYTCVIATSTDTKTWKSANVANLQSGFALNRVVYSNGVWAAVGDSGSVVTSSDNGATWNYVKVSPDYKGNLNAIAYGNNLWILISGDITTSSDGITWTEKDTELQTGTIAYRSGAYVAYGGNRWVAAGYIGSMVTSLDNGVTWTQMGKISSSAPNAERVIYTGRRFVIITSYGVLYSDGE